MKKHEKVREAARHMFIEVVKFANYDLVRTGQISADICAKRIQKAGKVFDAEIAKRLEK